jgi:hypothetical protein
MHRKTVALVIVALVCCAITPVQAANRISEKPLPGAPAASAGPINPPSNPEQGGDTPTFLPIVFKPPGVTADLADGWYLMVDDGHIAYREVERVYHPFKKYSRNPVMRASKPWEGRVIQLYGAVLPGFHMWYSSYNWEGSYSQVLYANSADGLSWNKPDLDGEGRNTMFGGEYANMVSVLNTPRDPGRPYKLMAYQRGAFSGYWSTDGIQTTPYDENPLYSSDSDVAQFYWDANNSLYRGTTKGSEMVGEIPRKMVQFLESSDFIHWSMRPEIFVPDSIDDQNSEGLYTHFYGMPVFPAGEQYLGLLWVFRASDQAGLIGTVDVQLASSHDGVNWIREEGERPPILKLGLPGAWDDGQIYTAIQPVRVEDELWLYYSGCNQEHGSNLQTIVCSIGLAKAGHHRLASLEGSGIVLTEPLTLAGPYLRLNYDGREGAIRVELLRDGAIIPGYEAESCDPLSKNKLYQAVTWSGETALPEGPFQIKFYLENSILYAFR